jgi:hypothetical protein
MLPAATIWISQHPDLGAGRMRENAAGTFDKKILKFHYGTKPAKQTSIYRLDYVLNQNIHGGRYQ